MYQRLPQLSRRLLSLGFKLAPEDTVTISMVAWRSLWSLTFRFYIPGALLYEACQPGQYVLSRILHHLLPCCTVACAIGRSAMQYLVTIMTVLLIAGPRIAAMLKIQDGAVVRIVSNDDKIITDTRAEADRGPGSWCILRDGNAAMQVRDSQSMQYVWRLDTVKNL